MPWVALLFLLFLDSTAQAQNNPHWREECIVAEIRASIERAFDRSDIETFPDGSPAGSRTVIPTRTGPPGAALYGANAFLPIDENTVVDPPVPLRTDSTPIPDPCLSTANGALAYLGMTGGTTPIIADILTCDDFLARAVFARIPVDEPLGELPWELLPRDVITDEFGTREYLPTGFVDIFAPTETSVGWTSDGSWIGVAGRDDNDDRVAAGCLITADDVDCGWPFYPNTSSDEYYAVDFHERHDGAAVAELFQASNPFFGADLIVQQLLDYSEPPIVLVTSATPLEGGGAVGGIFDADFDGNFAFLRSGDRFAWQAVVTFANGGAAIEVVSFAGPGTPVPTMPARTFRSLGNWEAGTNMAAVTGTLEPDGKQGTFVLTYQHPIGGLRSQSNMAAAPDAQAAGVALGGATFSPFALPGDTFDGRTVENARVEAATGESLIMRVEDTLGDEHLFLCDPVPEPDMSLSIMLALGLLTALGRRSPTCASR